MSAKYWTLIIEVTNEGNLRNEGKNATLYDYESTYLPEYNNSGSSTDPIVYVLEETLTNYYDKEFKIKYRQQDILDESYTSQNDSQYSLFGVEYTLDANKVKGNESEIVNGFKRIIEKVFDNSFTEKVDAPAKPEYFLFVDEAVLSYPRYDASTDSYYDDEGGGYKITYNIKKGLELPPVEVQTQPDPVNVPQVQNVTGPDLSIESQISGIPVAATQSAAEIQKQEQIANIGPSQSNAQGPIVDLTEEQPSRAERTGQDPNSSNTSTQKQEPPKTNVVNITQPTIKAKEIKFELPPQEDQKKEIALSFGNLPFIWYNSYQIHQKDIEYFQLSTTGNLPRIVMNFRDSMNMMKDKGFPLDDTKISIFINPRSKQLKPIHMDFKIVKFNVIGDIYSVTALIDVNDLYVKKFKSLSKMTSFEALKQLSSEIGLGFASNVDNTDDRMTWINSGERIIDFLESIVDNSYKSDETYLLSYIDFYYNLTYIDLEKELNRDIKNELGVANIGLEEVAKIKDQEKVSGLFLTNDFSMQNSNSFFRDYRVINNSTAISLDEGYLTRVKFYDQVKKDFLVFDIDSITSEGDKNIILKGSPQSEAFYKQNINLLYTGKLDEENMHRNYHYSYVQNLRNIVELDKISLEIEMQSPNYNVYKFQKINILISNQASTPSASHINNRLSGEWMIVDIKFRYQNGKYNQIIKLITRELNLSPDELQSEAPQAKKSKDAGSNANTSNDNTNPTDATQAQVTSSDTLVGATSSPPVPVDDSNFLLTKEMFRAIYKGKINEKLIEQYYGPMKKAMIAYKIDTKERVAAFLSQVNAETNYLLYSSEIASGSAYEGRKNLGNVKTGDGKKFKGRGLIQLTGRTNYQKASDYFNKDFMTDSTVVAADNETHKKGAATSEQVENTILTSTRYWRAGSAWGDLNEYADKMDISKSINFGSSSLSQLPESNEQGAKYGVKKAKNYCTSVGGQNDQNFLNLTIICFGVNGGYNGYKHRFEGWLKIRELIK